MVIKFVDVEKNKKALLLYREIRQLEITEQRLVFLLQIIRVEILMSRLRVRILFEIPGIGRVIDPRDDRPFDAMIEQIVPINPFEEWMRFHSP